MKKNYLAVLAIAALAATLGLAACSSGSGSAASASASASGSSAAASSAASESASAESSSASAESAHAYGYAGTDPIEAAAYKYMAEEVSKSFEAADASIPIVQIISVDESDPNDVIVYGDFWIFNYNIEENTLACESGGDFPGVMHMTKDGDAYVVTTFDKVADGADFDSSAKELFGEYYDGLIALMGDSDAREALRTQIVATYVAQNGLDVTQYQDYGWDPVAIAK